MNQRKPLRKKRSRKPPGIQPLTWLLLMLCVAAGVFFISGGIVTSHGSEENQEQIRQNLAQVAQAEEQNAAAYSEKMQEIMANRVGEVDITEERAYILSLDPFEIDIDELKKNLSHTAIVGDSLVAAASEYNILDNSIVIAKIGASVATAQELFEQVKAARPQIVFLCFGVNDIEIYAGDVDIFITEYRAAIEDLKESLPNAVFYVQGLLPASDDASLPFYSYRDEYNQELQDLCEELSCQYFDSSFILESDSELYDTDGVHPMKAFYPLWLTYLADIAGLTS